MDMELCYCLNVHPGATPEQLRHAIHVNSTDVYRNFAQLTGRKGPYGVGLWFSGETAQYYSQDNRIKEFIAELHHLGLRAFTFNGFPYGVFHGTRVKEQVYQPDWSMPERLSHTIRLARLMTHFLPEGGIGSISTVPVGYRTALDETMVGRSVDHLIACAEELQRIKDETGKTVQLALEPEPDCLLEDTPSTLDFFLTHLKPQDNQALNDFVGICLDLTHVAMAFETPVEALQALIEAEIMVPKIQLGASLAGRHMGPTPAGLDRFIDDTYLHQTRVRTADGEILRYPDLPEALAANPEGEWRTHYHVPLVWPGNETLCSTANLITPEFFRLATHHGIRHFEVETYTLDLFPDKTESTEQILARELAWVVG